MARNAIQFQHGLTLSELQERYGSEEQCEAAIVAWRWPQGFVCPHCGGTKHAITGQRRLYACHSCRRQVSIKSGTVFENTMLPLTKWFQAMWLITSSKNSISTLAMSRHLGIKWDSAWLMRQKLMSVMAEREETRVLDGRVEMDDVVLGGEKSVLEGGKQGRGGPNKLPFVVAVETTDDGRPKKLLLHVVKTHDGASIEAMARKHLAPTARVVSDGLGCFRALARVGCAHEPVNVTKANNHSEKLSCFKWVNTITGNVKTAISGTLKAVRPRYAFRYLAEFQYRFNRRFDLAAMLDRLAYVATNAKPRPYQAIRVRYKPG